MIGGNDSKVVIPESKFKQLKLAEMPANDHPTSTAVYCYSSCSIDITKLAKGKFDFSGWSKSTSCDVSLLLDGKKVGADHKIEDPSKFIDFSEDTTNWELTDNSIITMNVNCPENVVIRLNGMLSHNVHFTAINFIFCSSRSEVFRSTSFQWLCW